MICGTVKPVKHAGKTRFHRSTETISMSILTRYHQKTRYLPQPPAKLQPRFPDEWRHGPVGTVLLSDRYYSWSIWDGQQLGRHFALDTETTLIEGHAIPELAMVAVSDGAQHLIVSPGDIAAFLVRHMPHGHQIGMHNVAFDFWVLDRYLAETKAAEARNWLWSATDADQLHDTMLLAGLINLAEKDEDRLPSLADAARDYLGISLAKDTYRTRYGEAIGADWGTLDRGFFDYAVSDAIATYELYCQLTAKAHEITTLVGCSRKYGLLTEHIQTKAAIVLAAISRAGMCVDLARAAELRREVDEQIQDAIQKLTSLAGPEVFHRYKKTGHFKINKDSGLPRLNTTVLVTHLQSIAKQLAISVPSTASGRITTSTNQFWGDHRHHHPLIETFCRYAELTKLRSFFDGLTEPVIHPRYRAFVRTGRTSCFSPNIQQLPRGSKIREIIIARAGNLLLLIDYSAIELRTLAAVCYERYGFSKLGEVIKAGIDPHAYTASMFAGVGLDEFHQLPNAKQLRQQAKAINFGFPGGLGAASLVTYARHSYGVDISQEQAEQFRDKLCREVYPELQLYLSEDSAAVLARTLQADVFQVRTTWGKPYHFHMLRKIVSGNPFKADGTPYLEETTERMWQQLQRLNNNPDMASAIAVRDTSHSSPLRRLMYTPVTTPTGRIRGGVSFTAARNTPFQGLAADGAKLAMWELLKAGYTLIGFVHDEFIIELSKLANINAAAADIDRICCESMQQLVGDIPVTCEYALAERWYKSAVAVYDDQGLLQPWRPKK